MLGRTRGSRLVPSRGAWFSVMNPLMIIIFQRWGRGILPFLIRVVILVRRLLFVLIFIRVQSSSPGGRVLARWQS